MMAVASISKPFLSTRSTFQAFNSIQCMANKQIYFKPGKHLLSSKVLNYLCMRPRKLQTLKQNPGQPVPFNFPTHYKSHPTKKEEGHVISPMKFFRIIAADITPTSKLKLPGKFAERYGANVPGNVRLQVPTGANWRVEVKKNSDGVWLGKGWAQFAESVGVKYGHFLVFDYDETCAVFHVVAIGMSAVETEYPAASGIYDENEEEGYQGVPARRLSGLKRPVKEEYDDADDDDVVIVRDGKPKTDLTTIHKGKFGREIILNSERRINAFVQGRRWNRPGDQTEKAIERAKAFKADEPVCIIAMSPYYVSQESLDGTARNCRLLVPMSFIETYFTLKIKDATLRTPDGRTWSLKYRFAQDRGVSYFTSGWKQFVRDMNLNAGDVCLFELIRGAENALKVVVFRATDEDEAPK